MYSDSIRNDIKAGKKDFLYLIRTEDLGLIITHAESRTRQ